MSCLSHNTIVDLVEQRLDEVRRAEAFAHIDACPQCRELVALSTDELAPAPSALFPDDEETAVGMAVPLLVRGAMVDHYRVQSRLGTGGMGEVYLAVDTHLDRKVALKLVKPEMLREDRARERFIKEARATARLNHPNIVTIHGVGENLGQPYVALELLEGRTLRAHLNLGPVGADEIVRIGHDIAGALAAAHEAGVYHRDLKPNNIMLCIDGRTRVLDFGLAEVVDPGDEVNLARTLTKSGDASSSKAGGTPSYMAPEQWLGSSAQGTTDTWALGVILFEMATGRRPHRVPLDATTIEQLRSLRRAVLSKDVDLTPLDAAGIPASLRDCIAACLVRDPKRRATATEIEAALVPLQIEAALSSLSAESAQQLTVPPPALDPRPSSKTLMALGTALTLVTGAAAAFSIYLLTTRNPSPLVADRWPLVFPILHDATASPSKPDAVAERGTDAGEPNLGEARPSPPTGAANPAQPNTGQPNTGQPNTGQPNTGESSDRANDDDPERDPWDPMSYR